MDAPTNPASDIRERKIILALCLLAAAHVFIFSAAFPFFNVVDEQMHLDLVVRYSQADIPRALTPPAAGALPFLAIYGTPEYLWTPASQPGGIIPPPPWKLPIETVREKLLAKEAGYQAVFKNHEASQPPLYYVLAGGWWRLGQSLGLDGGRLLYWLRFLNVPLVVALVWLGGFTARKIFPENEFIRVAVPALIALLPQTAFYSVQNDVLSPLVFGAAFVLLLNFWEAEPPAMRLGAAAGLALAATFLTKISNLPLLAVAGIFIALKMFQLLKNRKLRASVPSLAWLAAGAGLPMAAWMAWCQAHFGDLTGSSLKIQFLNWTTKPFTEWIHHPLFTPAGFWCFLKGNLATFWQGEMLWHRQPLALPAVDLIYVWLTLTLLSVTLVVLVKGSKVLASTQARALWFSLALFTSLFVFYALLSVKYDFQDCFYPSRAHPFFVSGRLLLGALIPFLLLFAFGLDQALKKFGRAAKSAVLAALLLFMLISEIVVDRSLFANTYNWFHL
jgi:hypothetical protein